MKDFIRWFALKPKLDASTHKAPFVSEGDIWWASIGENIGSEIGGKSDLLSRPVVIYKKLANGFYFVIPTSTKEKSGSWYTSFGHKGVATVACLHQARSIDHRRLSTKLGTLSPEDFSSIKTNFHTLYK